MIKWSAPEFHYHDKDVSWYWIVALIAVALLALALWQKNFLFAVFIVLAALLVIVWGRKQPKMTDFILSEKGLDIGGKKFYSYSDLEGFTITPDLHNQELSELVLKTKNRINAWIKIIIADQRSAEIKKLLSRFLPEIEHEESLAEHIGRWLKF